MHIYMQLSLYDIYFIDFIILYYDQISISIIIITLLPDKMRLDL